MIPHLLIDSSVGWGFGGYNASVLVPTLMAQYRSLVEEIYADGGRKFLFVNVPSVSRSPYILDQGQSISDNHAAWTTLYNEGLAKLRADFIAAHRDVIISHVWFMAKD
jgi:hypothetical protein